MFERYTESARRALFYSRYEVSLVGATSIEPEHLLVGVAVAARGMVARILEHAGLSTEGIRKELEAAPASSDQVPESMEVPFSPSMKRVLDFTAAEADALVHGYIGLEHLLLGLLREDGSKAAAILAGHGLTLTELRVAIQAMSTAEGAVPLGDPAAEIEQIQTSVDVLGSLSADSGEARDLRQRIRDRLEELKRLFKR